jgi:negative regulator of flagellin synthesis FlgM
MKISPQSPTDLTNGVDATQTGTGAPRSVPSAPEAPATSTTTEISAASRGLQTGAVDSAIDVARVSQIQQAISEGRFKIDTGVVADKLIASVRELLARS